MEGVPVIVGGFGRYAPMVRQGKWQRNYPDGFDPISVSEMTRDPRAIVRTTITGHCPASSAGQNDPVSPAVSGKFLLI